MSNLDLSIIGIIEKAITLAPTASSEELLELSRAARNLDQSENADVEIAINSRIEEISPEATHWDLRALGKTVANLLEREEVSFAGGDIGKGYLPAQHHQQGKYLVTSGADESYGSGSSKTWVRPTTKNIDDFTVGSLYPNTTFQYNEVTGKYITEDTVFPIIISELSDLPAEGSTIGELAYDTTRGQMRFWNGEKWQFVNIRYAMGGWYENEDFSISVSSTSFNVDEAILDESLERYTGIFGKKDTASVSSVSFNADEAILDESLERYTGIFGKKDTASVSSTSFNANEAILDESLERYTGLFGKKDAPSVSSVSFNADSAQYDNQPPIISNISDSYVMTSRQNTVITASGADPEGKSITWSYQEVLPPSWNSEPSNSDNMFDGNLSTPTGGVHLVGYPIGSDRWVYDFGVDIQVNSSFRIHASIGATEGQAHDVNEVFVINGVDGTQIAKDQNAYYSASNPSVWIDLTSIIESGILRTISMKPVDGKSNPGIMAIEVDGQILTGDQYTNTSSISSSLNGTTVSQSNNVFTITPGIGDANFTLRFIASDNFGTTSHKDVSFTHDYINAAPEIQGIESSYTLTQEQDTIITATAIDVEGDAITWSFEEIKSGSNYVIVNAFRDDDNGFDSGSVYVYDANDLSAQPTKLTAFDGAASDYFGRSVATAADKIIVGATGDNDNGHNSGSVYVYDANDLSDQPTKLTAFDGAYNDHFGISVAATADKIVVGAMWDQDNGSMSGSVYVYDANDLSASPTKLTAFDGAVEDWFGYSVAATADKIVVSAFFDDDKGSGSGSVYVYDANDLSAQPTKLTAFDGAANDVFSGSVAATSDKIIVGAYADDDNGSNSGSVYVYDANNLSAQPTKLTAFDGAAIDQFGWSIAAIDDKIFVSAAGDESNSGSIYVYDANDLSAQPTKLTAFDGAADDRFGHSVTATSDKIIVSANGDDAYTGSVYIFDTNDLSAQPTKLTAFDGAEGDQFGYSVAAISAPSALNGVTVTQSDNVFTVTPGTADANFQLRITATDTAGNVTSVTSDFDFTYVNQAPSVAGIESSYALTQGQDTVITASATDPEGDAITWSYEEIPTETSLVVMTAGQSLNVYDNTLLETSPIDQSVGRVAQFQQGSFGSPYPTEVVVSNNRIFVGDSGYNNKQGSILVYDINSLETSPSRIDLSGGYYGGSTIAGNDNIIVTYYNNNSVRIYDTQSLSLIKTLHSSSGSYSVNFGSIVVGDEFIFIGASRTLVDGVPVGSVDVYRTSNNSLKKTLYPPSDANASPYEVRFSESFMSINDKHVFIGTAQTVEDHGGRGSLYAYALGEDELNLDPIKLTNSEIYGFGYISAADENYLVVGGIGSNKVAIYNANDLSQDASIITLESSVNGSLHVDEGILYVNLGTNGVYVYNLSNLEETPKFILGSMAGESKSISSLIPPSALNGVTVSQSDNVFTVTPGTADADFRLRITATDSEGNATSVTSDFTLDYVNQAPSVTGIESSYTLTQGQDTVITAEATDIEGDDITWSFEEIKSGASYMIVGAWGDDDNVENSGSVYVYDANDLSASPTKLTAFDGDSGDFFGYSVDATDDKIIVGAFYDDDNGNNSGSVYVYDMNDLSAQPTKLTAFDGAAEDRFGSSVAVTDDKIIVGAFLDDDDGEASGSIYVYDTNDLSAQPTKLTAFDGDLFDYFGYSVAANSDKIVVGAMWDNDNEPDSGSVYVYDANDLSAQPTKLTAFDGVQDDWFGRSVAATDDKIIVGAFFDDDNGNDSGSVYVYDANDLSAQPTKLTAFDAAADDRFGYSVDADADKIFVYARGEQSGRNGAVYIYDANDLSAQPTKLTAFDGAENDYFGASVAATADKIFVGARGDDDNGENSGSVYVYDANDLSAPPTKLTAFDGVASDWLGNSIVVSPPASTLNGVTVSQSDNVFTVTPAQQDANFTLTFKATDTSGNVTSVTSDFNYDYNAPPVIMGIESVYTLTQGVNQVIVPMITDAEGETVTMTYEEVLNEGVPSGLNGTTITQSGNDFTIIPGNADANFTLRFTATDTAGNTDTRDADFSLNYNVNPVLSGIGSSYTLTQDQDTVITAAISDADGDPITLTYAVTSGDMVDTTISQSSNVFTVTPGVQDASFQITFTATDPYGGTSEIVSDFNYDYNAPPVISGIEPVYTLTQGVDEVIVGMSSDADGDAVTWSFAEVLSEGVPSGLNGTTITQNGGEFTVTPGMANANFTIRFTLTDTAGNTDTRDADFSLTYVNQAPAVSGIDAAYTLTQGQDTVITAAATDPEGDAITWSYNEVRSGANYVIVGSPRDDELSGSVYVYDSNDLSASPTKLTAFDGESYDMFGSAVAVTNDKIIVCAEQENNHFGAVYVYDLNDLSLQPTKLTAFDGEYFDHFGSAVAANSDKIVVGARYEDDNGMNSGSVYVYDINNLSDQPTKLMGFNSPDRINNEWWHSFDTSEHDSFGVTVAATSDKIIVGAIHDDDNASNAGAIYVFDANDLSAEPAKLTAFDGFTDIQFGRGIAVTDDKIIVGAVNDDDVATNAGAVYVYNINDLSSTPTKLTAYDGAELDNFGIAIAATTDKIVVSAYRDDDDRGSVYVYDANNLSGQPTKLTPHDGSVDDYFGISVAVTDDKVFVGCHFDDDGGSSSGSVYVYDLNDLSLQPTKLTAFDGVSNDQFGTSVVAIYGPSAFNGTTVSQSDNVFTVTPGSADATFQLNFKATDTSGNTTSVTSDFDFTYVNQAPAVSGIESSYTLTQGQDTVITATATDVEGDDITWSYEALSSTSQDQLFVSMIGVNSYQGQVYVYNPTDLTQQPTLLSAPNGSSSERFGYSMEIDSDKVYIGEMMSDESGEASGGAVYIYDRNDLSAAPTMLLAPTGEAQHNLRFGSGILTNDDLLIIGAYGWGPTTDASDDYTGKVYIYNKSDLSLQATLIPTNGDHRDYFGLNGGITVTSNHILVGAMGDDDEGTDAGSVYVYDVNTYAFVQKLTAPDASESDRFGAYSIKTYGDKVYISAPISDHNSNGTSGGAVYVYNESDLSFVEKLVAFDAVDGDYFGMSVLPHEDKLFVGAHQRNSSSGAIYVYNINNLSAAPTVLESPATGAMLGYRTNIIRDKLYASAHRKDASTGGVYVYSLSDLSAAPELINPPAGTDTNSAFGFEAIGSVAPNPLGDVTVTQSDNVFTVTPGNEETSFQLTFKATDSEGNVTSTTSDFTVVEAPTPQMGDLFIGSDGYSTGDFNNESEVDAWTKTSNTSWLVHRSGEGGHMEMGWGTDNQVGAYIELDVVPNTEYTISFSGTATSGAPVGHANYRDAYVNVRVVDSEPVGTNAAALILQTTPSTTGGTYPNGSTASNGWQPQTSKSGYQTLSGTITPHGSKLTIQILNVDKVVQYFDDFSVTGLVPV